MWSFWNCLFILNKHIPFSKKHFTILWTATNSEQCYLSHNWFHHDSGPNYMCSHWLFPDRFHGSGKVNCHRLQIDLLIYLLMYYFPCMQQGNVSYCLSVCLTRKLLTWKLHLWCDIKVIWRLPCKRKAGLRISIYLFKIVRSKFLPVHGDCPGWSTFQRTSLSNFSMQTVDRNRNGWHITKILFC